MRKNQKNSTSRMNRIGRRQLVTEQLEKREMLAADVMSAGAAFVAVGSGCESLAEPAYVNVASAGASSNGQGNVQASVSNGNGGGNGGSQQSGQGQSGENQVQSELSTLEI